MVDCGIAFTSPDRIVRRLQRYVLCLVHGNSRPGENPVLLVPRHLFFWANLGCCRK